MALSDRLRQRASSLMFAGRHIKYGTVRQYNRARDAGLQTWERVSPNSYNYVRQRVVPKRILEIPGYGETVSIDGIVMRIDPRMSQYNIRKLADGRHTAHERLLLSRVLREGDRLLELGGGIGMVAIHSSLKLGSENVFSYEANPTLETLIRDNYALNGVSPTLVMAMVGPEPGSRTFHVNKMFSRSSVYAMEGTEPVEVPVLPFNDEMARIRPTALVIDIQGGEAEWIDYAKLAGVRLVLIELHPDMIGVQKSNEIRQRLRDMGFSERERSGQSFLFEREV